MEDSTREYFDLKFEHVDTRFDRLEKVQDAHESRIRNLEIGQASTAVAREQDGQTSPPVLHARVAAQAGGVSAALLLLATFVAQWVAKKLGVPL